jgi:hypothetical protein
MATQSKTLSTPAVGSWLSIVAGALIAAGVFLPWISLTVLGVDLSKNAFQLGAINGSFTIDGVIALALAVVAVVIGIAGLTNSALPRFIQRSPIIVGIGAGVLAATRISALNTLISSASPAVKGGFGNASIGAGFYLVAVGAGMAVIAGLILRSRSPQPQAFTGRF